MRHYFDIFGRVALPVAVLAAAPIYQAIKKLILRWGTGPVREWPTVGAVIDVVSVAEEIREGSYDTVETTGYKASLTYFYRNPDLQMGEYSRSFPLEGAASRWAERFKGKNILVHVNPKDPSDSVLLKADLESLEPSVALSLEDSLRLEKLPELNGRYLILSGVSEFVSIVGLSLTAAGAWMHLRHRTPAWLQVTLIAMMALNFITVWIVSYRADDSNRLQSMLYSYTLFCPGWMRWGVRITGALLFLAWAAVQVRGLLSPQAQHWLAMGANYWLYLFGAWIFLSTGATHAAILRSQELTNRPPVLDGAEVSGRS